MIRTPAVYSIRSAAQLHTIDLQRAQGVLTRCAFDSQTRVVARRRVPALMFDGAARADVECASRRAPTRVPAPAASLCAYME